MSGHLASRRGVSGEHSAAIDALFTRYDNERSPGVNIAVIRHDRVVHQRGYGVANVEDDVPFAPNTVLRLGSTTKHLCAACVLLLESRGVLTLQDDVRHWLPELPRFEPPIRLEHLLAMTSGLRDGLNMLLFAGMGVNTVITRKQVLALLCNETTTMFAPGEDCRYSNTNYALLSELIERVSGMPLAEFMTKELFAPLGMHDTALVPYTTSVITNAARGYQRNGDAYEQGAMLVELSGDGGVASTLEDMVRWYRAYTQHTSPVPDLRARLEAPRRLNDGRVVEYRLGINVRRRDGVLQVSHAGGMPGYLCDFAIYPEQSLGIVLFSNVLDPQILDASERVAALILGTDGAVHGRAHTRSAPLGFFASVAAGLLIELAERDGEIVLFLLGEMHPLGWTAGATALESRKRGVVVRIEPRDDAVDLVLGAMPPVRMDRVARPEPRTGTELSGYIGRYGSRVMNEYHDVDAVDGQLVVTLSSPLRSLVWKNFVHVTGDLFTSVIDGEPSLTNVQILFRRDADAVCGLTYNLARCCGVAFERTDTR